MNWFLVHKSLPISCHPFPSAVCVLASYIGPVETAFGTHLIYVETCNKPENTWKKLFDDIVEKVSGKEE